MSARRTEYNAIESLRQILEEIDSELLIEANLHNCCSVNYANFDGIGFKIKCFEDRRYNFAILVNKSQ